MNLPEREEIGLITVGIIAILGFLAIWMFPIGLCYFTDNWWLMFIYFAWWLPAIILTNIWTELIEVMFNI